MEFFFQEFYFMFSSSKSDHNPTVKKFTLKQTTLFVPPDSPSLEIGQSNFASTPKREIKENELNNNCSPDSAGHLYEQNVFLEESTFKFEKVVVLK